MRRYRDVLTPYIEAYTPLLMAVKPLRRSFGGVGPWARFQRLVTELDQLLSEELATRLDGQRVTVNARAGEGGKLFGSITSTDIAQAVQAQTGVELDRRSIDLAEPIKELGGVDLTVQLHPDVPATFHVEVVAG